MEYLLFSEDKTIVVYHYNDRLWCYLSALYKYERTIIDRIYLNTNT